MYVLPPMTRDTTDTAAATATRVTTMTTTTTTLGLNLPSTLTAHLSALTRRIYGLPPASSSSPLPASTSTSAATAASGIANATSTTDPLAQEVAHNLEYQHDWTDVSVFSSSSTDAPASAPTTTTTVATHKSTQHQSPVRTILIGSPPTRLYVHPDQQILELSQEKTRLEQENKKKAEKVYVVPTRRTESLSLIEITAIFDRIPSPAPLPLSPSPPSSSSSSSSSSPSSSALSSISEMTKTSAGEAAEAPGKEKVSVAEKEWERIKRVLLAVVDDDSTVAYYILHDGVVKPRQN